MEDHTNTVSDCLDHGELLDTFDTDKEALSLYCMGSGVRPFADDNTEVMRYDLVHSAQDRDAEALPYWGSIAQTMGEGEEPDAPRAVADWCLDILHVHDALDEAGVDLDELSIDDRHGFCAAFGCYVDQFGGDADGEQLRAFLASVDAAKTWAAVGINRDDAAELFELAENEPAHELRA